jgi:hypothetical protein
LTPEDIRAAIAYGAASVAHEEVVLLSDAVEPGRVRIASRPPG